MPAMTPKCLLVDDDSSFLMLMKTAVQQFGFEIITAQDGDEGFAAFREHHPDLVVSDIHMPNRNGLMLLADIKSMNPDIPVILVTGLLHLKAVLNMESVKPDLYMEKPFTLDQLKQAIDSLQPAIARAWGASEDARSATPESGS
jgi:CheY-like chemotaxis protein